MKYIEYINKQNALNYLCDIAYKRGLSINNVLGERFDKGNFSRMRNGKSKIPLDIIMYVANRLDVNLEDVLRDSSSTNPDFFEAVESIRYYSQVHDYEACKYLIKKVNKNFSVEILQSIEIYQHIHWHEAIVLIEMNKEYYSALTLLEEALSFNNKHFKIKNFNPLDYTELETGIINSILICYFNINGATLEIKNAYKKLKDCIDNRQINDYETAFDIYYEYLITCVKLGVDRMELLSLAEDTTQIALENGLINKLPFIYYQTALLYVGLQQYDKAEEYFNSAIFIFKQIKTPDPIINSVIEVKHKCLERK